MVNNKDRKYRTKPSDKEQSCPQPDEIVQIRWKCSKETEKTVQS